MMVLKCVMVECIEEILVLFCNNCYEFWLVIKRGFDINYCKIVSKINRGEVNLIVIMSEFWKCFF